MSMIERVARALCKLDGNPENATMDGKPLWMSYIPEARAAIDAMREDVSRVAYEAFGCCATGRAVSEYMERAIDAALGDEK